MKPYIHPATPPKLRAAFRRAKNMRGEGWKIHVLAEQIGVNVGYLHRLIKQGIEPPDTTEKGRETRVKMFLPARKRRPRAPASKPAEPKPNFIIWWWSIDKETRHMIIRQAWVQLNGGPNAVRPTEGHQRTHPRDQRTRPLDP